MAAFLRGSLSILARGHRATIGRLLKRGTQAEVHEGSESRKGGRGLHRGKASKKHPVGEGVHRSQVTGKPKNLSQPSTTSASAALPPDTVWIDTDAGLLELVTQLRGKLDSGEVRRSYIDTEADSLHHYTEKLCLIQLACDGTFALIDTLAITDLSALLALLDSTEIWLHGADYDLTLLKKTYGWSPKRICDTQIAARLCGQRPFGLAALVGHYCGVALCKSSQKADWSQRPLPAKMQAYAVDDVRYLGRLADIFMAELAASNRLSWFEQSCATLRTDVLKRPDRDRDDAWRISGCGRLKPAGLAMLRELWLWRDGAARERDVPPFKVLNNQQLVALATEFEEHGRATHSPRWRSPWREGFRAAVERVSSSDPKTWPQQPRHKRRHISESQRARIEQLCAERDRKAESLGIETALLGSRGTLEEVILQSGGAGGAALMPWQREVLGLPDCGATGTA